MEYYAVPKKMSEVIISEGKLVWFPYLRIVYYSDRKRNDILVDSYTPHMCGDPLSAVLFSRKTNLIKLADKKPLGEGLKINHMLEARDLLEMAKEAYRKAEELEEASIKSFREGRELEIDWQRYRALFIPTRRMIERKEPIFKYFVGKRETHPYTIALFIKGLIQEGLKIKPDSNILIQQIEKVYYPIVVSNELKIYEIAWKLDESMTYKWAIEQFGQVKNFFQELVKG